VKHGSAFAEVVSLAEVDPVDSPLQSFTLIVDVIERPSSLV
jgi:hypothetical protein